MLLLPLLLVCCLGVSQDDYDALYDQDGDGHYTVEDGRGDDCDDTDPGVFGGASEVCDGQDNNCDRETDEGALLTFHPDADGDGYGAEAYDEQACVAPEGHVADGSDCDDADPRVHPAEPETCDGKDNDCDDVVDDGALLSFYADGDGDGFGDPTDSEVACAAPEGYVSDETDCDDGAPGVHPGAAETCDGADQDCDGVADEDVLSTFYADADGDGTGDPSSVTEACAAPEGYVSDETDCDDGAPGVHPGAPETCDGADQDCDGVADEDVESTFYADAGGDGFGDPTGSEVACEAPEGFVSDETDCDDGDLLSHPGAPESWYDGIDQDCLGGDDFDADADGSRDQAHGGEDCDDTNGAVLPGASETWYDGVDQDCDGNDADQDADGYDLGPDCDDLDPTVHPDIPEICDGVDQDCDGAVDLPLPASYPDLDRDGWGDAAGAVATCPAPTDSVSLSGDCDDGDAATYPGALEYCDGVDNDCDSFTDEEDAVEAPTWYADTDGDGHGAPGAPRTACAVPSGYVADGTDCDDAHGDAYPDAPEICDGLDNDCDGLTDESPPTWYRDGDGDGYGTTPVTTSCEPPSGSTLSSGDCDDSDPASHPGAEEIPYDYVDQACDGGDDFDLDDDGFVGMDGGGTDCDDGRADTYLHALEVPGDGVDQDCDGDDTCDDLNQDCWADLVLAMAWSATESYVYWGSSEGFRGTDRVALPATDAESAAVADLDGDGWKDVVIANSFDGATYEGYSYVFSNTSGTFGSPVGLPTTAGRSVVVADLDEDGFEDLIFANAFNADASSGAADSYVYWGTEVGYSTSSRSSIPTVYAFDCAVSDLDLDGWLDLVFATSALTGTADPPLSRVLWGSAVGFSPEDTTEIPALFPFGVAVEDLDGNGWPDVVLANYATDSSATSMATESYVYWNDGGLLSEDDRTVLSTVGASDVAAADLDQDGWTDLVFANNRSSADPYDGSGYLVDSYLYWGGPSGYSTSERSLLHTSGAYEVTTGDLDHDGWSDIVVASWVGSATCNLDVFKGSPEGFSYEPTTSIGTPRQGGIALALP